MTSEQALVQVADFLSILEQNQITPWLDSGTLLACVRDRSLLLKHKKYDDIDLGLYLEDGEELLSIFQNESHGYKINTKRYKGHLIGFRLEADTINESRNLPIDILVYRRADASTWGVTPFSVWPLRGLPKIGNPGWIRERLFSLDYMRRLPHLFLKLLHDRKQTRLFETEYTKVPYKALTQIGTWNHPSTYFESLMEAKASVVLDIDSNSITRDVILPIPNQYSDYLTHRYGNWRVQKEYWVWPRDDQGFEQSKPEDLGFSF